MATAKGHGAAPRAGAGETYRVACAITYPATAAVAERIAESIRLTGRASREDHEMRHAAPGDVVGDIPAMCVAGLLASGAIVPTDGTARAPAITMPGPMVDAWIESDQEDDDG